MLDAGFCLQGFFWTRKARGFDASSLQRSVSGIENMQLPYVLVVGYDTRSPLDFPLSFSFYSYRSGFGAT